MAGAPPPSEAGLQVGAARAGPGRFASPRLASPFTPQRPPPSPPQTRLVENQPYDESLDVNETEDVTSIYAPSPPQPGPPPRP